MTRSPLLAALVAAGLFAPPAPAQQPPQFRPFNGVTPEQFFQSSVARRTDQLVSDLTGLKAAAAGLMPQSRAAVTLRADQAAEAARELARLARRSPDRAALDRRFATLGTAVKELEEAVAHAQAGPALAAPLARVGYTHRQLAATLASNDRTPDRARGVAGQLAEGLDNQAGALRLLAADRLGTGFGQDLDRAVLRFARTARRMHQDLDKSGDLARARRDYAEVTERWGEVVGLMNRAERVPQAVRVQLGRVDGLYRKLGEALAEPVAVVQPPAAPNPAGANPPGGPPPAPAAGGRWVWEPGTGWLWDPTGRARPATPLVAPAQPPAPPAVMAFGANEGGGPRVKVFHDAQPDPAFDFYAYDESFRGGVRVAVADLNGDGIPDVVTAPGKGMAPLVRVFDGRDMSLLVEFNGLDPQWDGGATVAAADLTRDGRALVAVAADAGGRPQVAVFDLSQGKQVHTFSAYPDDFQGGVRVAFGDTDGDGTPDLVTAPGPGLPPVVKVFRGADWKPVAEFNGFDPQWRGGVWVAAADLDRNGRAELVLGMDAGGPPLVRVVEPARGRVLHEVMAYPESFRGGVRVAVRDFDGDGVLELLAAAGNGMVGSPVRGFSYKTRDPRPMAEAQIYSDFGGGSFVAGGR